MHIHVENDENSEQTNEKKKWIQKRSRTKRVKMRAHKRREMRQLCEWLVARHREQVLLYLYDIVGTHMCVACWPIVSIWNHDPRHKQSEHTNWFPRCWSRDYAIRDAEPGPRFIKSARSAVLCVFIFLIFVLIENGWVFFFSLFCCWSPSLLRMRVYRSKINFDFRTKHLAC